ncbi:hypothetical protein LPJ56_001001 [Coemansia sp. RSA 2599]|nr:hypothetical protein LPJ75_000556 [Coemansia sp. RSA 2598]KAJ1828613.1 hypothetical protein LPJ56_001001 [Coemansia sp. RSA 2599]
MSEEPKKTPEEIEFEKTRKYKHTLIDQLKNGVIIEAYQPEHARTAQKSGVKAIIAMEGLVKKLRDKYALTRMLDPSIFLKFIDVVALPVIGRVRTGHTAEAYVMESTGADMIEESNNLATADENNFIDKKQFATPFMCTAHNLSTALARIHEGAVLIRAHLETSETEVHELAQMVYTMRQDIRKLQKMTDEEMEDFAESCEVPVELVKSVAEKGRLPVLYYASGCISTPADVAFFMEFGCDGVVLNAHVFRSYDPEGRISAMVQAVSSYKDDEKIAKLMEDFEHEEKV